MLPAGSTVPTARGPSTPMRVGAVVFDLDDTLYPQSLWLAGACDAVADVASRHGADGLRLRRALEDALAAGSDSGKVIDRAMEIGGIDAEAVPLQMLVTAFRSYAPARLDPFPGVAESLGRLAQRVPIALVTDGDPAGQRAKLEATGLREMFSVVVYSDEIGGRSSRKPNPAGMLRALHALGTAADGTVVIGDRPDKDVAAAAAAGMRAIRVRTGEYRACPDHDPTWAVADDAVRAVSLVEAFL